MDWPIVLLFDFVKAGDRWVPVQQMRILGKWPYNTYLDYTGELMLILNFWGNDFIIGILGCTRGTWATDVSVDSVTI